MIIVNYNGRGLLLECLRSLVDTTHSAFEIIVVDNGSTDDSLEMVKSHAKAHPDIDISWIALERNFGPARARNEGARVSRGAYFAFLDNDTRVDPAWMGQALSTFERDPKVGAIQSKLLFQDEPDKIDCAGEFISPSGFLIQRAEYKAIDDGSYDSPVDLLAAKSAGMFIRKKVFEDISGFDEDYFIYMEETDLCWRAWLAGHRTVFCPDSIVYHVFSSTKDIVDSRTNNYLIRFHGTKNYIMTLIKNFGGVQLFLTLPIHLAMWSGLVLFLAFRGNFRSAYNITWGIGWNVSHLPQSLAKRRRIQSTRVMPERPLLATVMKKSSVLVKMRQAIVSQKVAKTPENV